MDGSLTANDLLSDVGGVGGLRLALALSSDKARGKNSLTLQGKDLMEGMMVVLAAGVQT